MEYFLVHTCTAQNRLEIKWVEFKIFRAILTYPHKKLSWKNNNKQNSLEKTNSTCLDTYYCLELHGPKINIMMFKVVSGPSDIQFPPNVLFTRREGNRQFHPKKVIQVGAKTNKYQHSFIARKIRDWNSLPNSVIEKQSCAFTRCHF